MVELLSIPSFEWDSLVIDTPKGEDLILGFDFLNHFNPYIDWRQGLITFNADHKDYYYPSTSFSNEFSSAKSCGALVDEVFKEIQDVGEDNSVSSLHLFFGNMDLPPSSYHDSLEELWTKQTFSKTLNWPPPRKLKALQSFLGFANFYRHFIKNYSKKISSITSFLNKDSRFPLNEAALRKFHQIKEAFTIAAILSHFDPSLPTIVETDASDYALGALLSQISDSGKHPIAFDSHKLLPAELNYEIHYKELLGIVWALKRWRAFLLSLSSSFEGLTNQYSLQYFMSSKILTCRQAFWAEFLSEFHFSITYCPDCLATLTDALSCRDDVYPVRGEDFISKNPMNYQKIIKQHEMQVSKFFAVKVEAFSNLIE
ncbi:hypothetical protein O181_081305 [Austropuccinia psidii MF-1]|uniref:Reverse transcriptase/retrotransposon-derived protein RNase H-like domain-containing protein n=1 Tax=Austropuccinia psidii MF-1 TaxID=1389203 RepID=A0A9Q3FIR8_9BASI|nr:hypothetical protein [Austropuccinia psidii MF-1]